MSTLRLLLCVSSRCNCSCGIALAENRTCDGLIAVGRVVDSAGSPWFVGDFMRYPFTMIASDGWMPKFGEGMPHPRNYGIFARVLARYVREQKVLTLEDAVRRMTSLPATRFRIFNRGLLRPGMKADVVVFDAATVIDKSTYERPHQYSEGFRYVLVNGRLALKEGKMTDERPGGVLYGPAAAVHP